MIEPLPPAGDAPLLEPAIKEKVSPLFQISPERLLQVAPHIVRGKLFVSWINPDGVRFSVGVDRGPKGTEFAAAEKFARDVTRFEKPESPVKIGRAPYEGLPPKRTNSASREVSIDEVLPIPGRDLPALPPGTFEVPAHVVERATPEERRLSGLPALD